MRLAANGKQDRLSGSVMRLAANGKRDRLSGAATRFAADQNTAHFVAKFFRSSGSFVGGWIVGHVQ
jgi:hypothetical protein